MNIVDKITKSQIKPDVPEFRVGDTVRVGVRIIEGKRERIQSFEGIVMAIKNSGIAKNFIVRSTSSGVGVERTFPINSPKVETIEVLRKGKVRQAKPNFIRNVFKDSGKQVKIKERK